MRRASFSPTGVARPSQIARIVFAHKDVDKVPQFAIFKKMLFQTGMLLGQIVQHVADGCAR